MVYSIEIKLLKHPIIIDSFPIVYALEYNRNNLPIAVSKC